MKTKYVKLDRLTCLLGIAVVAGGIVLGATYLNLERKIHSTEAFMATVDHLYQDQVLSRALRTLHDRNPGMAAQRLDLLLCDDILRLDAELASADARQVAYVRCCLTRIAHLRPSNPPTAAGAALEISEDQIEAEKILARACGEVTLALKGDRPKP